jgi:hypothetical protein
MTAPRFRAITARFLVTVALTMVTIVALAIILTSCQMPLR